MVSYCTVKNFDDHTSNSTDLDAVFFNPLGDRLGSSFSLTNGYFADSESGQSFAMTNVGAVMLFEDTTGSQTSLRLRRFNEDMSFSGQIVTDDAIGRNYLSGEKWFGPVARRL